ncbi:caspase domain-containing protein [Mycena galopus ATCC 62051]|nr:caspase domain-containing protein [Mycena galopus ATCC 62051]
MSQHVANEPAVAGDHVFALIIGIDKYQSERKAGLRPLEGAVNDAEAFREFLVDSGEKRGLGVPELNILLLKNETATRQGILDAFMTHLLNNPRIPDGGDAAMIFFFAGHGTRVSSPGNKMSPDEKVEGICPVDERTGVGKKYVHTIPDYVLIHLLEQLSKKKGQNITAIFDSCYSGGMGRDDGDEGRARGASSEAPPIPPDLDIDLFTNNGPDTRNRLWTASVTTHVWLAACGADQTAREVNINGAGQSAWLRGRFTRTLIENLRQVDRGNTTYAELIQRLGSWPTQTPCCGGERRNLLLLDTKYPPTGPSAMPVFIHQKFYVEIGQDAGVDVGTKFGVIDGNNELHILVAQEVKLDATILELDPSPNKKLVLPDNARVMSKRWDAIPVAEITQRMFRVAMGEPAGVVGPAGDVGGTEFRVLDRENHAVCTLVAKEVRLESTILVLHPRANPEVVLPEDVRAVISDWKHNKMILGVFVPHDFAYLEALFPTQPQSNSNGRTFVWKSRADAHIALRIPKDAKDILLVERFTPNFKCEPEARFPLPSNPVRLPNALDGIAHFNYFLRCQHGSVPLHPGSVGLAGLVGHIWTWLTRPGLNPAAISPLAGVSLEMYRLNGKFPTREPHGGNLVKNNEVSFKCDPDAYYGIRIHNTTAYDLFPYLFAFDATEYTIKLLYEPHGTEAPLRSNSGEVTVGMGGQRAFKFGPLAKNVKQSSTFLKLFVATKPIDITWIQQTNPFDSGFEGRPRFLVGQESLPDMWEALRITMTMIK